MKFLFRRTIPVIAEGHRARDATDGCLDMRSVDRSGKWLLFLALAMTIMAASGCRTAGYYAQAVKGQYGILWHEEKITKILADPRTPAKLKDQLQLVQQLRAFATNELKLPVDSHYQKYVDLHRPYVVWNVQAARQFSLEPKTWWYPIVGQLEYRGYFSERGATNYAAFLTRKGYDVYEDGVEAYSTLGWFKDPVLNTFLDRSEPELAELIFHELGHQRLFVAGDTDFNEAYATTVGQEGAHRWLRAKGDTNLLERYDAALQRDNQFVHLVMAARERLKNIYGDTLDKDGNLKAAKKPPMPAAQLHEEKRRVFSDLRRDYAKLKDQWGGFTGYDDWFNHELNNAQLNTIANYYDYLPGFERLLQLNGGDLAKFYVAIEKLGKEPKDRRHQSLRDLVLNH